MRCADMAPGLGAVAFLRMVVDQRDFLQRNRFLSRGRLRIRLSLADGKHHIQHHLHRQRRIDDPISGGGCEPTAQFLWDSVAPVTFNDPSIVPFGGTEKRSYSSWTEVCMPESAIGKTSAPESPDPGAQVLQLNSPYGGWVEDQDFNQVQPVHRREILSGDRGSRDGAFRSQLGNNAITPVDVLMAGFYNLDKGGVSVAQKTVTTGSVGAQGTWTTNSLVPLPPPPAKPAPSGPTPIL